MNLPTQVFISVGSNLGDPLDNCRRGIDTLCGDPAIRLQAASPFYRSEPVDFTAQEWFVNAVIEVLTTLAPAALLARMQAVQRRFGRRPGTIRFGPRLLDLDIIFYGDLVIETGTLVIPHPRMHKRRFVLQPICDIDPTIVHPVIGLDVQTILNQLVTQGQEIVRCSSDC